ncbi:MAG TPA: aminotransferase class III-fold pyridoxal phosphate-dependent enzyme [Bacillota bacterium]|jgi:glutamate-1-semialdehyde 2,1-aminomutase|nr:aminotransferase class III-fold pyridoxal phosphate-dependent enzyme [Bacillota bacterium]HOA35411.1 aminotransferase class III-fold pyridoxal phosphate-dependent enzyme [Bacillota bacterium]HOJ84718.1 aminotransferase class III-fold pyridoxal phosphate-dependent enzyme [Bacillota bacterium]HOL15112.1 aminotransferase class III-fold pyridoxal phosphate-dependent enzyme [Bacillota bacterium]HPZ11576.1 aminotransferase class III-fold pyridoxal phosphate-dependent enzyme [Bacillota bacterium]
MDRKFAISEYPDAAAVIRQLDELIRKPIYTIKPDALKRYEEEYYGEKCKKSKEIIDRAVELIPGGVQHNLAFNHPFPLVFTRAEGAYLYDIDGNRYYDFLQAGGPTVLGSNPPAVREKVFKLLNECGPSTGLFHEYEYKLAQKICELMPSVEMFRMLNSGTEGCMVALRIARLATGKKHILKMGGAYHGWSDQLAYGIRIPGSKWTQAPGIPRHIFKYTQEFFPNDLDDLERKLRWNRLRGGTAAVLMEPVGPESGTRPLHFEFNREVERLCRKYGALLIFDEVVTAFRLGLSGAQGYFGVDPDLTVFGKVVAGGYPSAGGIGGKKEYMKYLAAGIKGGEKHKKALVGGTMAANPLSCVAGYYTICEIERTGAAQQAGRMGDRLTRGMQELITKYNLPFVAFNQGSIVHLETVGTMHFAIDWSKPWRIPAIIKATSERKKEMEHMGAAYMAEGLVTLAGSRLYTSAAYNEEMIDDALSRFERVFANVGLKEN